MDRPLMIKLLVQEFLERVERRQGLRRLAEMLENGFPGYGSLSDEDLVDEIERQGLATPLPDEDEDFDDLEDSLGLDVESYAPANEFADER
ncbi:MAG: hypothetical protein H7125_03025 [Proteobacteria bacterium]|nr:hypothetical protein [Burkholderiales bacterium]